ncbi:MAG: ATP-binding protein [Gemmatimonadota bacterium]|nr:ATP-binding protein [Gemmatimonadota bacterium]MDH5803793.1 ATP-binding protein [Gemmatimonadota bacterium]
MTRVVEIPSHLDHQSFDQFAKSFGEPGDERLLFDGHSIHWGSPYALTGLLSAGQWLKEQGKPQPLFTVPNDKDVAGYWARAGFFEHAVEFFELHGKVPHVRAHGTSDVLLPVTPIRGADDVHGVVDKIQEHAQSMLRDLGLESQATMGFAMALSEACQNIVEHAGTGGWVAVQAYHWRKRLGRRVVVIAVADGGVGFKSSLEPTQGHLLGDRWSDSAALEAAIFQGVSRFRDPGRGQGLAGMRRYVDRWQGKLSLRSGTARLSIVPPWDDDVPMTDHLPPFPGSQVLLIIPARQES